MSVRSIVRTSMAAVALLGLVGHAQGPGSAAASPQTPAPGASPPTAAPSASPPPPPATPAGPDPLLEFVPREHIPADSAVSFPVDI